MITVIILIWWYVFLGTIVGLTWWKSIPKFVRERDDVFGAIMFGLIWPITVSVSCFIKLTEKEEG